MLSFKENNQREFNNFKKNDQYSPPNSQNLCWKYEERKNSRNLIQFIHRKFKEIINGLVVPKRRRSLLKDGITKEKQTKRMKRRENE